MGATGEPVLPDPLQFVLNWGSRYRLSMFNLGLACCAVEFAAAATTHDLSRLGVTASGGGPADCELMVVSGTVTDKLAPAVRRVYERLPAPRYVISFGACANCGGPYWDSYCVTKGVDQIIPVDVYVPGCPPRPEALMQGIVLLHERVTGPAPAGVRTGSALTAPLVPRPVQPGGSR